MTYNKINDWVGYLHEGVNCASDQFVVALSNTAPASEAHNPTTDGYGTLANVTQIDYTNCSTRNITTTSSGQTNGTYKLTLTDLTLTASGVVGPFRYVYIYDDTVANDPLVCYYDYGSSVTLQNSGDMFVVDFDGTNGFFTVA